MPTRSTLLALLLACCLIACPGAATARQAPVHVAHRAVAVGFAIPLADGSPGGWIGSYRVAGHRVYCADPRRDGPGPTTRYLPAHPVSTWHRLDGTRVPAGDLARTAWVLARYGDTARPVQAAAVDTVVYALTSGGTYAFGGQRSEQRLRESGHHDAIRRLTRRYLTESLTFAVPDRLLVHASPAEEGGRVVVTARVVTARGVPVPGLSLAVSYGGTTRRALAGPDGRVRRRFPAGPVGHHAVLVRAAGLPSTQLRAFVPTSQHQRMFVSGSRSGLVSGAFVAVRPHPTTPAYATTVSSPTTLVGDRLTDRIRMTAVRADRSLRLHWALFGPFPSHPVTTSCTPDRRIARGGIRVARRGVVTTRPVTLTGSGWFTYVEWNRASSRYRAHHTLCGERGESTFTDKRTPTLSTHASRQRARAGDTVTDSVVVTGLGDTGATLLWRLLGPRPPRSGSCAGLSWAHAATAHSGALGVTGDGTYPTPGVRLREAGCYTYVETLPETATTHAVSSPPGQQTETSLVRARPRLHTLTSDHRVTTGSVLRDTVVVSHAWPGLHQRVVARLYGPFASRSEIACTGAPYATARVRVRGNGRFHTSGVRVREPGVYTWREALARDVLDTSATHRCGQAAETTHARRPPVPGIPEVPTGFAGGQPQPRFVRRNYVSPVGAVHRISGNRLLVPRLGITTPVDTVRLDDGVMAVPNDPHRVGWLRSSAHASDVLGVSVIAGHVSDRADRPGALWRLRGVRLGDRVSWVVDGRRQDFLVTRVARYDRSRILPRGIFSNRGRHLLRLVTCAHKVVTGSGWHYHQNLVVTATSEPTPAAGRAGVRP